jgi:8-oxo-dGTP diphosphatase
MRDRTGHFIIPHLETNHFEAQHPQKTYSHIKRVHEIHTITQQPVDFRFKQSSPRSTTDGITEYALDNEEGVILETRLFAPYGIAIPGGLAELGMHLEENNEKEISEETSLRFLLYNPEHPLCVRSDPIRDQRGHMIANVFVGIGIGTPYARDDAKEIVFCTLAELDTLINEKERWAFDDHALIMKEYLDRRRSLEQQLSDYAAGRPPRELSRYAFFSKTELEVYKRRLGIDIPIRYDGVIV